MSGNDLFTNNQEEAASSAGESRGARSESPEPRGFEQALAELEQCVRLLDSGEPSLEDSLKLFEDGVNLVRECQEMLDAAEAHITELTSGVDGIVEKPFDP